MKHFLYVLVMILIFTISGNDGGKAWVADDDDPWMNPVRVEESPEIVIVKEKDKMPANSMKDLTPLICLLVPILIAAILIPSKMSMMTMMNQMMMSAVGGNGPAGGNGAAGGMSLGGGGSGGGGSGGGGSSGGGGFMSGGGGSFGGGGSGFMTGGGGFMGGGGGFMFPIGGGGSGGGFMITDGGSFMIPGGSFMIPGGMIRPLRRPGMRPAALFTTAPFIPLPISYKNLASKDFAANDSLEDYENFSDSQPGSILSANELCKNDINCNKKPWYLRNWSLLNYASDKDKSSSQEVYYNSDMEHNVIVGRSDKTSTLADGLVEIVELIGKELSEKLSKFANNPSEEIYSLRDGSLNTNVGRSYKTLTMSDKILEIIDFIEKELYI